MKLEQARIGLAVTGSFCTLQDFLPALTELKERCASLTSIFSPAVCHSRNRFSSPEERSAFFRELTGQEIIVDIDEAEKIGPNAPFDLLCVAPCTGNTLAKLQNGITDTAVTMAVKAHLRNRRPVLLAASSNDLLGANAQQLGALLNRKFFYFVPLYQDDAQKKPTSLSFRQDLFLEAMQAALGGEQLQPLLTVKEG